MIQFIDIRDVTKSNDLWLGAAVTTYLDKSKYSSPFVKLFVVGFFIIFRNVIVDWDDIDSK